MAVNGAAVVGEGSVRVAGHRGELPLAVDRAPGGECGQALAHLRRRVAGQAQRHRRADQALAQQPHPVHDGRRPARLDPALRRPRPRRNARQRQQIAAASSLRSGDLFWLVFIGRKRRMNGRQVSVDAKVCPGGKDGRVHSPADAAVSAKDPEVVIHVVDDVRGHQKPFHCSAKNLLDKMPYFTKATKGGLLNIRQPLKSYFTSSYLI